MTDETPRDSSGQFSSAEPAYGLDSVEQSQGFTQMPAPETPSDDIDEVPSRDQFDVLRQDEQAEITPVGYLDAKTGERVDEKETIDLNRAADDLGAYQGNIATHHESSIDADFAAQVDAERAELLAEKPELSREMGLEQPEAPPPELDERQIESNPKVREYIANKTAETEQAATAYKQGLANNDAILRASWAAVAPELLGLPPQDFSRGLELLLQIDPERGAKAISLLKSFSDTQTARAHHEQYEAGQQQQKLFDTVKVEDDRLVEMVGKQTADEATAAFHTFLRNNGVSSRDQMIAAIRANPVLATAEARQLIHDAAKYKQIMDAPKARPRHTVPNVQRPGISAPRVSAENANIQALDRELTRTGSQKVAEKLLAARMRARG